MQLYVLLCFGLVAVATARTSGHLDQPADLSQEEDEADVSLTLDDEDNLDLNTEVDEVEQKVADTPDVKSRPQASYSYRRYYGGRKRWWGRRYRYRYRYGDQKKESRWDNPDDESHDLENDEEESQLHESDDKGNRGEAPGDQPVKRLVRNRRSWVRRAWKWVKEHVRVRVGVQDYIHQLQDEAHGDQPVKRLVRNRRSWFRRQWSKVKETARKVWRWAKEHVRVRAGKK